jgi:DNA-binding MarR family transcriptional regulator
MGDRRPTCPTDATLDVIGACALALADAQWGVQSRGRSDAAALSMIHDCPGISIDELAKVVGLSHSATVRLVDRLAAASLLRRSTTGPGRRVGLDLTGNGKKVAIAGRQARQAVLDLAVGGLDSQALEALKELARRIVLNISHDQAEINRACRLCDQEACVAAGCPLPGNKSPDKQLAPEH